MEPTKILVVDDEPDVEHLIKQKFRRSVKEGGLALQFASNGAEALTMLRNDSSIAILLTDINMPEMDGLSLLSRLPELKQDVTAVVISAYGDMENIRLAMNRGSFDFLTKPIDLNDLEITLEKAIETMQERARARQARETFGRYVSDEVVARLLSTPEALELGGELRTVTLLLADIRGFTTATEGLDPGTIVEILNVFLGEMVEVISAFGGTIDNFIGDGILVVFGAPVSLDDDCYRAAGCAIAMQQAITRVNQRIESLTVRSVSMGIGIHTGDVVVGNIGSNRRMKYSVVGSNVNLASRVESSTVGGQILITDATRSALEGRIDIGRSFTIKVKGVSEPVAVHELIACNDPYNLRLDVGDAELNPVKEPIPLQVSVFEGKSLSDTITLGNLTGISTTGATLTVSKPLAVLTDVRIEKQDSNDLLQAIYGKVTHLDETTLSIRVRFTGLSPAASDVVDGWIATSVNAS